MNTQLPVGRDRDAPPVAAVPVRWTLPGFAAMTRLSCSFAEVHAGALRARDLVRTRHGEFVPILWVKRFQLDDDFLARRPDAQPIRIRPHALGPGLPDADILLSPGQRLAPVPGRFAQPVRAGDLLDLPGVFRQPETSVCYTLFRLGAPAEIRAAGLYFQVGRAVTAH
ncbi:Hint domain-containing protein [Psychromarinibacter sp. C21-152]|uniref:Hint domain-containing protein n=1 Tax=Psychromarinibacter sediminicola TaxID=3033385 RepID=A0AAE3T6P2_9RHOB|nr:Hint domain-containing protein [Psychromarinibacter sediminicola]MDF0599510.1 Hint domain-containing protein [Psychromarinibacter sediminicola]